MVSPPARRAIAINAATRSPGRRDRQSSRSSSRSDRPRFAEKRDRLSPDPDTPMGKRARLTERDVATREPSHLGPVSTAPPDGRGTGRGPINPHSARLASSVPSTAAVAPSVKPFAPPSGPRSERFGSDRFGAREPPRGPAAERHSEASPVTSFRRFGHPAPQAQMPQVAEPKDTFPIDRNTPAPAVVPPAITATSSNSRLEAPRPEYVAERIPRPVTPASASSHRSPGTPASGADSLDRRPQAGIPASGRVAATHCTPGERGAEVASGPAGGANPYTSTPSRQVAPPGLSQSAARKPEKIAYDREWKRYKAPVEPMILDRSALDNVLKEQPIDEGKTKFVTVRSREISKYSGWEGEVGVSERIVFKPLE